MLTFGLNLLYCQSTGNVPEVYTLHCHLVQTVQHTQHVVSSVMSTVLICIVTSHSTLFKEHFSPSLLHSARLHNDLGDTQCLHGNQSPQSDWWVQTYWLSSLSQTHWSCPWSQDTLITSYNLCHTMVQSSLIEVTSVQSRWSNRLPPYNAHISHFLVHMKLVSSFQWTRSRPSHIAPRFTTPGWRVSHIVRHTIRHLTEIQTN